MPPQTYIDAETRLHDVRVYVDGLHGETHAAAVAAAERLRNLARNLWSLESLVNVSVKWHFS